MTDMGTEGGDGGPLRGDSLIRSYINRLRSLTTTPISNYKEDPIYLSNFGVMTELDGGRRTFFHNRGANALWKGDDLDFESF